MTYKIGNLVIIETEESQLCEFCGKIAETRPYGKNGAEICFRCAMKPENKEETERQFKKLL